MPLMLSSFSPSSCSLPSTYGDTFATIAEPVPQPPHPKLPQNNSNKMPGQWYNKTVGRGSPSRNHKGVRRNSHPNSNGGRIRGHSRKLNSGGSNHLCNPRNLSGASRQRSPLKHGARASHHSLRHSHNGASRSRLHRPRNSRRSSGVNPSKPNR